MSYLAQPCDEFSDPGHTANDWVLIRGKAKRLKFGPGEEVIRQGFLRDTLYIIRRGTASVTPKRGYFSEPMPGAVNREAVAGTWGRNWWARSLRDAWSPGTMLGGRSPGRQATTVNLAERHPHSQQNPDWWIRQKPQFRSIRIPQPEHSAQTCSRCVTDAIIPSAEEYFTFLQFRAVAEFEPGRVNQHRQSSGARKTPA